MTALTINNYSLIHLTFSDLQNSPYVRLYGTVDTDTHHISKVLSAFNYDTKTATDDKHEYKLGSVNEEWRKEFKKKFKKDFSEIFSNWVRTEQLEQVEGY
jgi:hypothetical protein